MIYIYIYIIFVQVPLVPKGLLIPFYELIMRVLIEGCGVTSASLRGALW